MPKKIFAAVLFVVLSISCAAFSRKLSRQVEKKPRNESLRVFDKVKGYNGNTFYISRPKVKNLLTVSASLFGMDTSSSDNTAALQAAFEYCKGHPDTELRIGEGTYHFSPISTILLDGLKNIFVNGSGAKFIIDKTGTFMTIAGCDCLEINGITVDWDREKDPLDDVARVRNSNPDLNTLELVFFEKESVSPDMSFWVISLCDPEFFTFGGRGLSKECYLKGPNTHYGIKKVEQVSPNILKIEHDGCFSNFSDGETYLIRHYSYRGNVFLLEGQSRNITLDGVKIYGSPGVGVMAQNGVSHFQILNCIVGVDPDLQEHHHISLIADAFHIVNTNGCFRVAGNDVSRQGDDGLNVHDGLGYVTAVKGNVITAYSDMFMASGDTLRFKDERFLDTDAEAVVVDFEVSDKIFTITLDRDVSASVRPGFSSWDTRYDSGNYVIENNCFHEHRARALLLQSSEGLCRNNRFYKTQGQAIKIVMDIAPGYWLEGKGVNGLEVSGNTFDT